MDHQIDKLVSRIKAHSALAELDAFGKRLAARPLSAAGQRVLFATMGAFWRNVPTGILALALRVADDKLTTDRFGAIARAASLLLADVDEFGLHEPRAGVGLTHHQLFHRLLRHLGIADADLDDRRYQLAEGRDLGALTAEYYRTRSIADGLGFHLASEETSLPVFVRLLDGFVAHARAYGMNGATDPALDFLRIHTLVEDQHRSVAASLVAVEVEQATAQISAVESGARVFLDGFEALFAALNHTLDRTA